MSDQMSRALYLGCFLLMLVLAFSAFIMAYQDYQVFISRVFEYSDHQGLHMEEAYTPSSDHITGTQIINLILARRRADEVMLMDDMFGDSENYFVYEAYPELVINGESYQDCDVESIAPDGTFQPDVLFGSDGKPIKIEIRGR